MSNIGLHTYSAAAVAFAILAALLLFQRRRPELRRSLLAACALTSVWAATIALGTLADYPPLGAIRLMEAGRDFAWLFVLLQLLGMQADGNRWRWLGRPWRRSFAIVAACLLLFMLPQELPALGRFRLLGSELYRDVLLAVWLLIALSGLLLIEQLYRNGTPTERWSLKFFCFAIGTLCAYDFFLYAEALLFRQLNPELWQARGLVVALVSPWLAVAIARNREWQMDLHVSRQVVFHSVTLMAAGVYLIGMASAGYLIQFIGGSWGGVLQISFLAGAIGLLISLLFSGKLRANTRVWLSKHFFSYRYDYREEWLKFTRALATLSDNIGEGIIATMAPLASSPAGLLFSTGADSPVLLAHWQMPPPDWKAQGLGNLVEWMRQTDWVVDLSELHGDPARYEDLKLPTWLVESRDLWLLIPLVFRDDLEGILMLRRSDLKDQLNWEDRDLLKTAGRQAASHLAQQQAADALVEARQFDAFNRLSAYVIHDLKNILAQQSLLVSNAAKHRDNPAFIDDMISTIDNSVGRMQRLMEQMRSGVRSAPAAPFELTAMLQQVVDSRAAGAPAPVLHADGVACCVAADRDRLLTVFTHLVQNAQEATPEDGDVVLEAQCSGPWVTVLVRDSGRGMDQDFIANRLFRPFDTTKGLTGMGIGAFESREYIRQLGGEVEVRSEPGKGTDFTVRLPTCESASESTEPLRDNAA